MHGDYAPKNLIVYQNRVMVLDFEVAHWGDPSFDSAFMLTHLIAKAVRLPPTAVHMLKPPDALVHIPRRGWRRRGDGAGHRHGARGPVVPGVDGGSKLDISARSTA